MRTREGEGGGGEPYIESVLVREFHCLYSACAWWYASTAMHKKRGYCAHHAGRNASKNNTLGCEIHELNASHHTYAECVAGDSMQQRLTNFHHRESAMCAPDSQDRVRILAYGPHSVCGV